QKILLNESEALPLTGRVVGIEDSGQGLGRECFREGPDKVAAAELLEVELARGRRAPQAQSIYRLASVAYNWTIKRNADQTRLASRNRAKCASLNFKPAIQLDLDLLVRTRDLPGIGPTKPIVGFFLLPSIPNRLLEHPVFVPKPVAHCRKLESG